MSAAVKRLTKELKGFDSSPCWLLEPPIADDILNIGFLIQPRCSYCRLNDSDGRCYCRLCPYAEGRFMLRLAFPTDYPFKPPKASFDLDLPCAFTSTDGEAKLCDCGGFGENWHPTKTLRRDVIPNIIDDLFEPFGFFLRNFHTAGQLHQTWADQWSFVRVLLLGLSAPDTPLNSLNGHLLEQICRMVWPPELMHFLDSSKCQQILEFERSRNHRHTFKSEDTRVAGAEEHEQEQSGGVQVQVSVKAMAGKTCILNVQSLMLVDQLRDMVRDQTGIPQDRQRLIFAGKQLEVGHTLEDYGVVEDGCTLHLVEKLRGGAIEESGSKLCVLDHTMLEKMKLQWAEFDRHVRDFISHAKITGKM